MIYNVIGNNVINVIVSSGIEASACARNSTTSTSTRSHT